MGIFDFFKKKTDSKQNNTPESKPQDFAESGPTNSPESKPQDFAESGPTNSPESKPQEFAESKPQEFAESGPTNSPESKPQDFAESGQWGMPWQADYGADWMRGIQYSPVYGGFANAGREQGHDTFLRSLGDLARYRDASRACVRENAFALGIISAVKSYVIGTGMTISVSSIKDNDEDNALANAADQKLEQWAECNQWNEIQDAIFEKMEVDGEAFIRFFKENDDSDGEFTSRKGKGLQIRFVQPEFVEVPPNNDQWSWSLGVKTLPTDTQTVLAYGIREYQDGGAYLVKEVDADQCFHFKNNTGMEVKRGLPSFSFATLEYFRLAANLARNIFTNGITTSAIAIIREHATANQGQVEEFARSQNVNSPYPMRPNLPSAFQGVSALDGSSIVDIKKGLTYVQPPATGNYPQYLAVLEQALRCCCRKYLAPIWIISGDSSTTNFASSLTSESPFLRNCVRMQNKLKYGFKHILAKVLDYEALTGNDIPADWSKRIKIDVHPVSMEMRDIWRNVNADKVLHDIGVKSKHEIASNNGLDFQSQQKLIAKEQDSAIVPTAANGNPNSGMKSPDI